ncbi:TRAP transporter small permease [Celeribacter litoreus]|uniref:TRAP transporter small permease n=1 Tax=Celeribacter litoreus TaxID=2876714 RepID=UPI001CCC5AAD|nr:TRAP transporter small permease [Celeribacter litoreus]MCA0042741.1 TRAP transporter small permease [Celeribacter litoreus]
MTQSSKTKSGAFGLRTISGWVETAAAFLMGLVTLLAFGSAVMRYAFSAPIPDSHDIGRLALGVAIFWGVATVNYTGSHIAVDLLYEMAGKVFRKVMDMISTTLVLISFGVLTMMMSKNAQDVYATGEHSYDLRFEIWPAYWLMVIGAGLATLTTALRLWLILTGNTPTAHADTQARAVEE